MLSHSATVTEYQTGVSFCRWLGDGEGLGECLTGWLNRQRDRLILVIGREVWGQGGSY